MATATGSATLSFPSQEVMFKYLNNYDLLVDDVYLKEKGVIEKTARVFANTTKSLKEVQAGLIRILSAIGLEGPGLLTNLDTLQCAVEDCAAGKIFQQVDGKTPE